MPSTTGHLINNKFTDWRKDNIPILRYLHKLLFYSGKSKYTEPNRILSGDLSLVMDTVLPVSSCCENSSGEEGITHKSLLIQIFFSHVNSKMCSDYILSSQSVTILICLFLDLHQQLCSHITIKMDRIMYNIIISECIIVHLV